MYPWVVTAFLYVYTPFLFFEFTAQRGKDRTWHWPFHKAFVVFMFLTWPLMIVFVIHRMRNKPAEGASQ